MDHEPHTGAAAEAQALAEHVGVRDRDDLVEVRLSGDDQRSWLNGQVTNDVRPIRRGDSVYALAVTVRGRIMADVWVLDGGESLSILLPRSAQETVLQSFESQIIMEDVELHPCPDTRVLSLLGPKATELAGAVASDQTRAFPGDELGLGGVFVLTHAGQLAAVRTALHHAARELGGMPVSEAGYELCRLRRRRPRFELDFGLNTYPQEAGLRERAVSFSKGCYLGQEVICTLENRGKVARAQYALRSSGPLLAGSEIRTEDGTVAGQLTSAVEDPEQGRWLAMAFLKRARADARLSSDGTAVEVLAPVE